VEQIKNALVGWRWPDGFECPDCGGRAHCIVMRDAWTLYQCNVCRKQSSVKADTVFESSKLAARRLDCISDLPLF
jgi:ribosomal protein L37AE/L43A